MYFNRRCKRIYKYNIVILIYSHQVQCQIHHRITHTKLLQAQNNTTFLFKYMILRRPCTIYKSNTVLLPFCEYFQLLVFLKESCVLIQIPQKKVLSKPIDNKQKTSIVGHSASITSENKSRLCMYESIWLSFVHVMVCCLMNIWHR